MKIQFLTTILLLFAAIPAANGVEFPTNDGGGNVPVIISSGGQPPTVCQPVGSYNTYTHELTICFPAIGFSNYTIEVSSMYASLEYYVYTPTVQINLSQMLYDQVDLTIYTESGDIYYAAIDNMNAKISFGNVTIAAGTNNEHTGTVSLMPGFKVEKGASFSVKPSDY